MKTDFLKKCLWMLAGLLPCLLAGALGACTSDDDEPKGGDVASISVDVKELNFDSNAGQLVLTVTANGDWTTEGAADWFTLSPETGTEGSTTVTVSATANEGSEDRSCTLTFRCAEATAAVEIYQFGQFETDYVDLGFETDGRITSYDEQTGRLTVEYTGTPPQVSEGKATVLTEEYNHAIRVIRGVETSGNTLTLDTEAGNMCNLFRNIDFVLTTDPALANTAGITTRSGRRVRVVTPVSLSGTRADYQGDKQFVDKTLEYTDLLNEGFQAAGLDFLSVSNSSMSFQMKAYFYFSFGETVWNDTNIGDLQSFIFFLDGNIVNNMSWGFSMDGYFNRKSMFKLLEWDMPDVVFPIGPVPVFAGLNIGLNGIYGLSGKGELEYGMGTVQTTNARLGVSWTKDGGASPIRTWETSSQVIPPHFSMKGSLEASLGVRALMGIEIYNFIGPFITIEPELVNTLEAGMQVSPATDESYFGWTAKSDANFDVGLSLWLDLGIFDSKEITIPGSPWNVYSCNLLQAPARLTLVSPEINIPQEVGKEVEVTFRVTSESPFISDGINTPGVAVQFDTEEKQGGKTDKTFALSDADGLVTVKWTPGSKDDKLTATIVDANGKVISVEDGEETGKAVYEPELEKLYVELVSPKDGTTVEEGMEQTVCFRVFSEENEGEQTPREGETLHFTAPGIDATGMTDAEGKAEFKWTPNPGETLTAAIEREQTAEDGSVNTVVLCEATFTPVVIAPVVSLYSPADGTRVNEGEVVKVTFNLTYKDAEGQAHPYPSREVQLSSQSVTRTEVSDANGRVSIDWTPASENDLLTASVLNQSGTAISTATFRPKVNLRALTLVSPASGAKLKEGESVTVTFAAQWSEGGNISGEEVTFQDNSGGTLSAQSATTGADGRVSVTWTPGGKGGMLTATLTSTGRTATFSATVGDEEEEGGGGASELEKSIMGRWTVYRYQGMEDGESFDEPFPEGVMTLTLSEEFGFNYAYKDPWEPSESYSSTGTWWLDGNNLMVKYSTGGSYIEMGFCTIVSVTADEMVTETEEYGMLDRFYWKRIDAETRTWKQALAPFTWNKKGKKGMFLLAK